MSDEELQRLSVESSNPALRRALAAAERELPSAEHVEQMLARFPFPAPEPGGDGGPQGDGGGGAPEPAGPGAAAAGNTSLGLKLLVGMLAAGVVGGAALVATRPAATLLESASTPETQQRRVATVSASAPTPEPLPAQSASVVASTSSSASSGPARVTPSHPAAVSASVSAPAARPEMDILKDAQAARRSDPARALQLVDEHAAAYPKSGMAQEREMIRVEALLGVGRRAEAKALADAFRKAHPSSAYARRLDALLGE